MRFGFTEADQNVHQWLTLLFRNELFFRNLNIMLKKTEMTIIVTANQKHQQKKMNQHNSNDKLYSEFRDIKYSVNYIVLPLNFISPCL